MSRKILPKAREMIRSGQMDALSLGKKKYDLYLEPVCRQYALTRNELDVLLCLANNPDFDRAADIVHIRKIAKSHVSLSVTNLEQRGLLTREFDPDDRRTAHLKLTDTAREIAAEGARCQEAFFSRIFEGLSREELDLWRSLLDRVCVNISQM